MLKITREALCGVTGMGGRWKEDGTVLPSVDNCPAVPVVRFVGTIYEDVCLSLRTDAQCPAGLGLIDEEKMGVRNRTTVVSDSVFSQEQGQGVKKVQIYTYPPQISLLTK